MPDENKLQKLRDIGYAIPGLCGYCKHGNFAGPKALDGWGVCDLHRYNHGKHTNPEGGRKVSIHATGNCPQFKFNANRVQMTGLGAYEEFFNARPRAPHGS